MLCAESFVFPQRSVPNLRIDGEKAKSPKDALPQSDKSDKSDRTDRADRAERMSGSAVQAKQLQRLPHAFSVQVV